MKYIVEYRLYGTVEIDAESPKEADEKLQELSNGDLFKGVEDETEDSGSELLAIMDEEGNIVFDIGTGWIER